MSWFKVIPGENTVADPFVADADNLDWLGAWRLADGESVSEWRVEAMMKATSSENDGRPDDVLLNHHRLPIFSAALRQALENASVRGGIQYLPIHVLRPAGDEYEGYAVANIVERRAALDLERSDYDRFAADYFIESRRGRISTLRRTMLKSSALRGADILRLEEYRPPIFVSDVFRSAFENGGFTGWGFHPVEVVEE
jgi:hypothetical protein